MSSRVPGELELERKVTANVAVCDSSRSSNDQKVFEGSKILLRSRPDGMNETVKLAVAFETSDVFTNKAEPAKGSDQ